MRMLAAQVVNGRLNVPEGSLPEGGTITLLAPEGDEKGFELSADERKLLLESIAQGDWGEVVHNWSTLKPQWWKNAALCLASHWRRAVRPCGRHSFCAALPTTH